MARFRQQNASPARASISGAKVPGSGTVEVSIAMPAGSSNPEISEAFTKTPEVVYSLTVPAPTLVINRSEPSTAMPYGPFSPVINEAFTVAPDVVYSPTVPLAKLTTNRSEPDTAISSGLLGSEISAAFTV